MPYTKRFPIKGSITASIEYILNKEKTEIELENDFMQNISREFSYVSNENKTWQLYNEFGEMQKRQLVTGVNCNWHHAEKEFYEVAKQFGNENDKIQSYHTIQSFSWEDNVTPMQVHAMGVQLAKELYGDIQCVVTTHCDKGHLHNHIICNATKLNGKKLRDDFYSSETSLMKLREMSDRIAMKYNCKIIKDAPLLGSKDKTRKQAYMENINQTWSQTIKQEIDDLKKYVSSFDEMLYMLSLKGYQIKKGKHISVQAMGMERTRRLDTLGAGYTQQELKSYFARKHQNYIPQEELNRYVNQHFSEIGKRLEGKREENKESILKSQQALQVEKKNPKYMTVRERAMEEIRRLNEEIALLNQYQVYSFKDLTEKIEELQKEKNTLESQIEEKSKEMDANKELYLNYKIFLQYYNVYQLETDESIPKEQRVLSETSLLWQQISQELGNPSLDEVRAKYLKMKEQEMDATKEIAALSYKKYELEKLQQLKKDSLEENDRFIPSFEFTKKQIVESPHNDTIKKEKANYYYVRLPYTNLYTYILKDSTAWDRYERGKYYVVPDDEYILYDNQGNEVKRVPADEMAYIVSHQKAVYADMYKGDKKEDEKKGNPRETQSGKYDNEMFVFTVDIKMFDDAYENEHCYRVRLPYMKEYVELPKENAIWIKEAKTCQFVLHKQNNVKMYNEDQEYLSNIEVTTLQSNFEAKKKQYIKKEKIK